MTRVGSKTGQRGQPGADGEVGDPPKNRAGTSGLALGPRAESIKGVGGSPGPSCTGTPERGEELRPPLFDALIRLVTALGRYVLHFYIKCVILNVYFKDFFFYI